MCDSAREEFFSENSNRIVLLKSLLSIKVFWWAINYHKYSIKLSRIIIDNFDIKFIFRRESCDIREILINKFLPTTLQKLKKKPRMVDTVTFKIDILRSDAQIKVHSISFTNNAVIKFQYCSYQPKRAFKMLHLKVNKGYLKF